MRRFNDRGERRHNDRKHERTMAHREHEPHASKRQLVCAMRDREDRRAMREVGE